MTTKPKYNINMDPRREVSVQSTSVTIPDCLFGNDSQLVHETSDQKMIPLQKLVPSPRNPYHVTYGADDPWMMELCESIRQNGILSPLIVRPIDGTDHYEIISGHRRHHAATELGLKMVPVIVRKLNDDEAAIQMVDYNLNREELLYSEKAFAYRLKYEAIKHSWGGKRESSKQKSPGDSCSGNTLEEIAKQIGISPASVRNYLNLTRLCEEFLGAVDRKEIPMKVGVQISYLRKDVQRIIWQNLFRLQESLDETRAKEIRKFCVSHPDMDEETLITYISGRSSEIEIPASKAKEQSQKHFRMTKTVRRRYFPDSVTDEDICKIIHQLLHEWAVNNNPNYKEKTKNENP